MIGAMNRFNDTRRVNSVNDGGDEFPIPISQQSSTMSAADRTVYFEDAVPELNQLPSHWELPAFGVLVHHDHCESGNPLSTDTSLTSSPDKSNFFNFGPENMTQPLESSNQVNPPFNPT